MKEEISMQIGKVYKNEEEKNYFALIEVSKHAVLWYVVSKNIKDFRGEPAGHNLIDTVSYVKGFIEKSEEVTGSEKITFQLNLIKKIFHKDGEFLRIYNKFKLNLY